VVWVRKFRRDVELLAAAIIWPSDPLANPIEVRFRFGDRIGLVEFCDRVPEVLVFALEECGDKVVLRAEVTIEARLGDPGLFDHEVNADSPHASMIEKCRRRLENTVPHLV
jgi:hypothetical protein